MVRWQKTASCLTRTTWEESPRPVVITGARLDDPSNWSLPIVFGDVVNTELLSKVSTDLQELGAFHGWLRNLTNTISNIVTRPNRKEVERRIFRNFGEDGESNVSIQHDRESHLFLLSAVYRVICAVLLLAEVTMVVG